MRLANSRLVVIIVVVVVVVIRTSLSSVCTSFLRIMSISSVIIIVVIVAVLRGSISSVLNLRFFALSTFLALTMRACCACRLRIVSRLSLRCRRVRIRRFLMTLILTVVGVSVVVGVGVSCLVSCSI